MPVCLAKWSGANLSCPGQDKTRSEAVIGKIRQHRAGQAKKRQDKEIRDRERERQRQRQRGGINRRKSGKKQFNRCLGAIKIPNKKDFKTEFKQIPLLTQDPQEFKLSK
jgi:hypothetical protein